MDPTHDDLSDYDVISELDNRSPKSSVADLGQDIEPAEKAAYETPAVHEPPPSQEALDRFETASLTTEDIQNFAARFFKQESWSNTNLKVTGGEARHGAVRVYVDGQFDGFHAGHALQFRQAKLSFPNVHLIVGVFADFLCEIYESPSKIPHVERCEVIRHCRWVDEVLDTAPWVVDEAFLDQNNIDFVALEEGTSADPKCDKLRLGGYDALKKIGKIIPTRRTNGLASSTSQLDSTDPTPSQAARSGQTSGRR
jgi:cytidyltransferase-like protein